jgi:hypothetical protein
MLRRLGNGEVIAKVCEAAGISRGDFDSWWREECRRRVPSALGVRSVGVQSKVRIQRDRWGIAHVHAESDRDVFFGFGYATAQDRLFQLDWLRRTARGRLAEILGPEAIESDLLYRTIGLSQIAEKELPTPAQVLQGVQHILAELIAETADVRAAVRSILWETGKVGCSNHPNPVSSTGISHQLQHRSHHLVLPTQR